MNLQDELRDDVLGDGTPAPSRDFIVVGIGASAGGVEALEALFAKLPGKMGMAFVVIQHLSPDFESLMPQILARKTKMPVHSIEHNQKIQPNHVYVLPSGKDMAMAGRRLQISPQAESRALSRPIDTFFCSLAEDVGENAVAIVLSGTGTDGAKGVLKIHDAGGLVIAQSESSARFNGMPRSAINTGIVDSIDSVDEIPDSLIRFSELTRGESQEGFIGAPQTYAQTLMGERRILQLLNSSFGIDFDLYQTDMFSRRVKRRMCLTHDTSFDGYLNRLEAEPDELRRLYSDLLIGVTEFFRDPGAFRELRTRTLPGLLDSVANSGELRVWVSACATGEEAYSIAILIDEILQTRDYKLEVKIFATDANTDCIDVASRGIYPPECVTNVDSHRVEKYFKKVDEGYLVSRDLRKQIVFATHNLLQDAPFTKVDFVACRNLLMYLKREAKQKTLSLLNFSLKPDGVMLLGPNESPEEVEEGFEACDEQWKIFRKTSSLHYSSANGNSATQSKSRALKTKASPNLAQRDLLNVYDSLLTQYMPPGLLVDAQDQIIHVFGEGTNFLKIQPGRPPASFLEMLPSAFRIAVSNGLKRVRVDGEPVVYSGIPFEESTDQATYQISISVADSIQSTPKFLVTFKNSDIPPLTPKDANSSDVTTTSIERVHFLEEQLQSTRESLHDSILHLKSNNEEMQSTNEELIASNEELQSTNEELHSVNEELYTVNSEHQRKIVELTELTDDIENLLDSIQVDTIFLDADLKVRKFTLGIAQTFRLVPHDVGRHIDSFNHELKHDNIVGLVKSVLDSERTIEQEVQDKNQNWYLMRLLPYSSRGKIDGVLLTLIEITKMKETEQRLAELSEIVQSSQDAIFRITPDGIIRTWNRGSEKLFSHTAKYMIGRSIETLVLDEDSVDRLASALDMINKGQKLDHILLKVVKRNGGEVNVQMSVSPIYDKDRSLIAASIVLRDFTKQKNAETESQNAVTRRDQFLAMLSHELRNPIAAIMNALAVLNIQDLPTHKDSAARAVVGRQAKQLSKLLDDLLDVSRMTHDKINLDVKPIDLAAVSEEVVECVESRLAAKSQKLTVEIPQHSVFVDADVTRIIQAQVNLLINASKYTPDGGNIRYSITSNETDAIIEVEDDGEGMSRELLENVFEVFVQADQPLHRNAGGMGLGLPLVRMIARAHDGEVNVSSDGLGLGSKFSLKFPLSSGSTEIGVSDAEEVSCASLAGRRLMLVEDNDEAREMLAEYLSYEDLEVQTAANGGEGVELFRSFDPEVCVVDIGLPDLDGYEVARQIRKMDHQPKILIALTGYGQEMDRKRVLEAGFDLHVVKPVAPEQLVQTIAEKLVVDSVT